ncbi:hypothetical protein Dimus_032893 [Dionaea muscipula]
MDRFDGFRCSGEGGQEAGSSSRFAPLSELEEDAFVDGDDSLGDSDIDQRRIGSPCLDELVVETGVDVGGFESPSRGLQRGCGGRRGREPDWLVVQRELGFAYTLGLCINLISSYV